VDIRDNLALQDFQVSKANQACPEFQDKKDYQVPLDSQAFRAFKATEDWMVFPAFLVLKDKREKVAIRDNQAKTDIRALQAF